jgi:hypothetical protein
MGRSRRIARLFGFVRHLLEGKRDLSIESPWALDSLQKVLVMWPEPESILSTSDRKHGAFVARKKAVRNAAVAKSTADATFVHLRRLFRYGFRLTVKKDGLRMRQFFADGEIYRPEGYSRESSELIADLAHIANEQNTLRVGQCRVARAKPVLNALGFPDLDSAESFALQFAGLCGERWIFIDSRPELFRREIAAALAAKLASTAAALDEKIAYRLEPPLEEGPGA